MGFFKRLGNFFSSPSRSNQGRELWINVRCNRCGETIQGRVDLWNELSWADSGEQAAYTCRKVLMGTGSCFQRIEVNIEFDSNRKIINRQITGGNFIEG